MQVMTHPAQINSLLTNLRHSLMMDPLSWDRWCMLSLETEAALDPAILKTLGLQIMPLLSESGGELIQLDICMLAIFQTPISLSMSAIAKDISQTFAGQQGLEVKIISLDGQQNQALGLLERLTNKNIESQREAAASYDALKKLAPGIDDWLQNWKTASMMRTQRRRPSVLIVDDDKIVHLIAAHAFGQDYDIQAAHSSVEAVEKHLCTAPDIVFLDIGLPDFNGITLLNYMQQYDPDGRVIIFSSNSYLDNRLRAFASGASGFIAKPFTKSGFERYINYWCRRRAPTVDMTSLLVG